MFCVPACPSRITGQYQAKNPFNFSKRLGKGGFASVYQGTWNEGEKAFKVIPIEEDGTEYTTNSHGPYELHMQVNLKLTSRAKIILLSLDSME